MSDAFRDDSEGSSENDAIQGIYEARSPDAGKGTFRNRIFLLVADTLTLRLWQNWFFFIQCIVPYIQLLAVTMWVVFPHMWRDETTKTVMDTLFAFVSLAYGDMGAWPLIFICLWYTGIVAVLIGFVVYFGAHGGIGRGMRRWSNVILHIMVYWGLMPSYYILGTMICSVTTYVQDIFALMATVLVCIVATLLFVFVNMTMGWLAAPRRSIMASFDPYYSMYLLLFGAVKVLMGSIYLYFDDWYYGFIGGLSLLTTFILIFKVVQYPYLGMMANVLHAGFLVMVMVADIVMLIEVYAHLFPFKWLMAVIPLGGWLIGIIVFGIHFKKTRNKVRRLLIPDPDAERRQEVNIEIRSVREAKMYFSMGFDVVAPCVLNGQFTFSVSERFDDFDLWYLTTSILALIPGNDELFFRSLSRLRLKCKGQLEKMLIKRLYRQAGARALERTDRFQILVQEMDSRIQAGISIVKNFWEFITSEDSAEADFTILKTVYDVVNESRTRLKVLTLLYPNVVTFTNGYGDFKIECTGSFINGIELKKLAEDTLANKIVDPWVRLFCLAKPAVVRYLEKTCPQFQLDEDDDSSDSVTEHLDDASDYVESDNEDNYFLLDNIADDILQAGTLRLPIYRATTKYRPKGYTVCTIMCTFFYAVVLTLILLAIFGVRRILFEYMYNFELTDVLVQLRVCYGFSTEAVLLEQARKIGHGVTTETYHEQIPPSADDEEVALVPWDIEGHGGIWMDGALDNILLLARAVASPLNWRRRYEEFLLNDNFVFDSCLRLPNATVVKTQEELNLIDAMTMAVWVSRICTTEDMGNISESETMCLFAGLYVQMPDIITEFTEIIKGRLNELSTSLEKMVMVSMWLTIGVLGVLCIPFSIVPQILLEREVKKLFDAFRTVSPEAAEEAARPFWLSDEKRYHVRKDTQIFNLTNNIKKTLVVLRCVYGISFMACLALVLGALFSMRTTTALVTSLVRLAMLGGTRHPVCVEIMTSMTQRVLSQYLTIPHLAKPRPDLYDMLIQQIVELNDIYVNNDDGMIIHNDLIRQIEYDARCEVRDSVTYAHDRYRCLGLDMALATFLLYCEIFTNNTNPILDNWAFVNLFHLICAEMNQMFELARFEDLIFIRKQVARGEDEFNCLLAFAMVLLILNFTIDIFVDAILKRLLKAGMIVLRHVPPIHFATNTSLIAVFLPKHDVLFANGRSFQEAIFLTCDTPVVVVGMGMIVDLINHTFRDQFQVETGIVVGHTLTTLIPKPNWRSANLTPEEKAVLKFYKKVNQMLMGPYRGPDSRVFLTPCLHGDEYVQARITAHRVTNKSGRCTNVALFVENYQTLLQVRKELADIQEMTENLMNQLIPREIAEFAVNRDELHFMVNRATVVAIKVWAIDDVMKDDCLGFDRIIAYTEGIVRKNPPYVILKIVFNTIYAIGGLISDPAEHQDIARHGLMIGLEVYRFLNMTIPRNGQRRFNIACVTGGPILTFLVGDKDPTFEVFGSIVGFATDVLEIGPDKIILSQDFKEALGGVELRLKPGPQVHGEETFLYYSP